MPDPDFLSGVIEGFYGRPWTFEQRLALLPRLRDWGFTSYVYGPKDDIRLRARWREPYGDAEAHRLGDLVQATHGAEVRFMYAIAPGLDIRHADAADVSALVAKIDQLLDLGVDDVALLFDDIPHTLDPNDEARFGSVAAAQAHVAEALFSRVRERRPAGRRLLCPTSYCRRMADQDGDGWRYLFELGRRLGADVDVFWTGDEIVSERVDAASLEDVRAALGRKPVLWDNLHANDYDLRRLYLGPYAGRAADLPAATRGVLTNPNCGFEVNEVAFDTLAAYLRDPAGYRPEAALDDALAAWRHRFVLEGGERLSANEVRLLADLFYLPWRCGESVEATLELATALLAEAPDPADERLAALRGFARDVEQLFARLTELQDRELLYALYGVAWEARGESRLLAEYLTHRARGAADRRFGRPHPIPNTYRLGFAAAVQALLPLDASGAVAPRVPSEAA
jgi:hypothetical protein